MPTDSEKLVNRVYLDELVKARNVGVTPGTDRRETAVHNTGVRTGIPPERVRQITHFWAV